MLPKFTDGDAAIQHCKGVGVVDCYMIPKLIESLAECLRASLRVNTLGGQGYVSYINHMGDDNISLSTARMSTLSPTGEDEAKDDAFRMFLWRKGHMTPFESQELHVEIHTFIPIARQVYTYRSMTRNEYSGRYSPMLEDKYIPDRSLVTGPDPNNKQGGLIDLDPVAVDAYLNLVERHNKASQNAIDEAHALGVSNQLARNLAPMTQMTRFRIKGSLRNWAHFLEQRCKPDAQPEIQELGWAIAAFIKHLWPKHWDIINEFLIEGVPSGIGKSELETLRSVASLIDYSEIEKTARENGLKGRRLDDFMKTFASLAKDGKYGWHI